MDPGLIFSKAVLCERLEVGYNMEVEQLHVCRMALGAQGNTKNYDVQGDME